MTSPTPSPVRSRSNRKLEALPDGELVNACQHNDDAAWQVLVARHSPRLRAIASFTGLQRAAADDVVQAVWTTLHRCLGQLRDPQAVSGWLATTTRRQAIKVSIAQRRVMADTNSEFVDRQDVDEQLLREERALALRTAFGKLPARDQQLLRLLFAEERVPYDAIADAVGCRVGSIGPTRARSLARLRALLDHEPLFRTDASRTVA